MMSPSNGATPPRDDRDRRIAELIAANDALREMAHHLKAERRGLRAELRRLGDLIDEWQLASGCSNSQGDCSTVTPKHLSKYIGKLVSQAAEAAREKT